MYGQRVNMDPQKETFNGTVRDSLGVYLLIENIHKNNQAGGM